MAKSITLTVAQRINVKALLEGREARSAGDFRLLTHIIDKIALTPDEELKCGLRSEQVGPPGMGQTILRWNVDGNFDAEITLEDAEFDKMKEILSGPISGVNAGMRGWYEPLLTSFGL